MPDAPWSAAKVMSSVIGAELVVGNVADAADALEILVGEDRMRRLEPLLL